MTTKPANLSSVSGHQPHLRGELCTACDGAPGVLDARTLATDLAVGLNILLASLTSWGLEPTDALCVLESAHRALVQVPAGGLAQAVQLDLGKAIANNAAGAIALAREAT